MSQRDYILHAAVAVIILDNPPVNGLNHALRQSLMVGLARARDDDAVTAVVLMGANGMFSGGADIREFNTPMAAASPTLREITAALDAFPKLLVAAMDGFAMGGGLELALACHYRVALAQTTLALPEVKLGLLPGAGGTQRLPRLIPVEDALTMIVGGEAVAAERAKALGLLDEVLDGDLLEGAIAFAKWLAAAGRGARRVRDLSARLARPAEFFARHRAELARAWRGYPAPLEIVECVAAAVGRPFEGGLEEERRRFEFLVNGAESKAMRHAFFAERKTGKVPGISERTPPHEMRRAAVVGAGTMGAGIATCFASAGIPVTVIEANERALERGLAAIKGNYSSAVAKGRISQQERDRRLALVTPALDLAAAAEADIVIEAISEDLAVKQQVFRQLDAVAKPAAVLATNTSTLDVDRIASATRRPHDVIGTHFFAPAHVMRLLEVVRGAETSPEALATVLGLAKTLKKTPVVSRVCDGFIGNRMIEQYFRQALFLLDEGALPHQVDGALEGWGWAMGPFRMADLSGLDIGYAIRKRRYVERPELAYSRIADRLCELGRLGQKTGAGFYRYDAGGRVASPDPAVERLVIDYSAEIGLRRRVVPDEEIVARCNFALVNEAARILEEGIALRASDIDVVYLAGYGFPRFRGGPMFHADTVGLANVVSAMRAFAGGYHGEFWEVAPLLAQLAAEGRTFTQEGAR